MGPFFFGRTPVRDYRHLLDAYGTKEFASPTRSTVPLLALVHQAWPLFRELLAHFQMPESARLHFEFRVAPPRGRGKSSHTDLMACCDDRALAIEAKWREPRYQTVREWLTGHRDDNGIESRGEAEARPEDNRTEVLFGWLELLQSQALCSLQCEHVSDVVYQMLHRAASVCAASEHPQLAYLQFKLLSDGQPEDRVPPHHYDDLKSLHNVLGQPARFQLHAIEWPMRATEAFHALQSSPTTSLKVKRP